MKTKRMTWAFAALIGTGLLPFAVTGQSGWQEISTGYNYIWMNIEFPEGQNQVGYVAGETVTYNGIGKILKTTDGGATWTDISPASLPGIEGMCFVNQDTGYIGGWQHYFAKTTNGGTTWTQITISPGIWYIRDVIFWDADHGVVITGDPDIYVTSNGGATWTKATGMSFGPQKATYGTGNILFAACGDEKIIKSTNGGLTWNEVYSGVFTYLFLSVDFLDGMFGLVGGEDGKVLKTTNGGNSWTTHIAGPSSHLWQDIHLYNTDSAFICGTIDGIYKTIDGGDTWVSDYTSSAGRSLYDIDFTDDNTGFVCCSGGIILKKIPPFHADFIASDTQICTGDTVIFTNLSSPSATSFNWTFEGGTPPASTEMNPSVIYDSPGDFDVTLVASDGTQTDTEVKPEYIHVSASPAPEINGTEDVCQGETYAYETQAVTGDTYAWEVTGGEIVSGSGTSKISVEWNALGAGSVYVVETTAAGCSAASDFPVTIVICTGNSEQQPEEISIYPNPAGDYLSLSFRAGETEQVHLKLFDLLGKEIWSGEPSGGEGSLRIDMTRFRPGLYLLMLQTQDTRLIYRVVKH